MQQVHYTRVFAFTLSMLLLQLSVSLKKMRLRETEPPDLRRQSERASQAAALGPALADQRADLSLNNWCWICDDPVTTICRLYITDWTGLWTSASVGMVPVPEWKLSPLLWPTLLRRNWRPRHGGRQWTGHAVRTLWSRDPSAHASSAVPTSNTRSLRVCPRFPRGQLPGGAVGPKTIRIFLDRWLDPTSPRMPATWRGVSRRREYSWARPPGICVTRVPAGKVPVSGGASQISTSPSKWEFREGLVQPIEHKDQFPASSSNREAKCPFCFFPDRWSWVVYILNPDNGFKFQRPTDPVHGLRDSILLSIFLKLINKFDMIPIKIPADLLI